jgi:hypothetical protein
MLAKIGKDMELAYLYERTLGLPKMDLKMEKPIVPIYQSEFTGLELKTAE